MKVSEKLCLLREQMKEKNLSAYIIPSSDSHQSEYVADFFKARQWVSGFTGSAGTVVVTMKEAGLWTDGRYYIQAEKQLQNTEIKLFKAAEPNVPSYAQWLADILEDGAIVGINGRVTSLKFIRELENNFANANANANAKKKIEIDFKNDLIAPIWKDRPSLPAGHIFIHDTKFAGKQRVEKLEELRKELTKVGANTLLLTSLDDIAWLLNIRGVDVPNNPVAISYVLVTMDICYLFIAEEKVDEEVRKELFNDGILVLPYNNIEDQLCKLEQGTSIVFDPEKTSVFLYEVINKNIDKIENINITTKMKAIKNNIELENIKECMKNDGAAFVRFIKWLKENVVSQEITEIDADLKLLSLRKEQPYFVSPSFDSIIGYKENAAMMHYKAMPDTTKTLKDEGLLLVDSGGQYYNGTTDTTRTIVLGRLSEEEKRDYTLVLKGNIALASTKFLYGISGSNLDAIARQPLWKYGIDYKCGTGHGIGFFLNVHEGPHGIAMRPNENKLEKNMLITNEPGVYKQGKHGIRIENVLVVKEAEFTEFGQFMEFEDLTLCPIDIGGILPEMLNEDEKSWLNKYHKKVYTLLSPLLTEEEREWLEKETREI